MSKSLLSIFLIFIAQFLAAQSITQKIKGKIIDKDSKSPLVGVTVWIDSPELGEKISAQTIEDGSFELSFVPIGRQNFKCSYIGYKQIAINNLQIISGKETFLNLEMEEALNEIGEVEIKSVKKHETVNDMSIISARSFTVEEADKYPASRQDPARMAGNFAGVNSTSDARNDIVIRGNSPMGLLWRLNDIDIPNPSHFAISGSTGGPLSIINTKYLATSDFMTGAFSAGYGNANAGVFDLKMRNGNNTKYEFTGQVGVLGTELSAEGPFSKKSKASFLATFRYSTLGMLQSLKLPIGTTAIPQYSDWAYRLNLPTKKMGNFALFGIGGFSSIDILVSDTVANPPKEIKANPNSQLYGDQTRDQYFRTNMGVFGLQHNYSLSSKAYISSTLSQSFQTIEAWHDFVSRDANYIPTIKTRILGTDQQEYRTALHISVNKKISPRSSYKAGIIASFFQFQFTDSAKFDPNPLKKFRVRANASSSFVIIQPYIQWKYKLSEFLTFSTGLHGFYSTLNAKSYSVEPRAALGWNFEPRQTLSFGYGLHSQLQPLYYYFSRPDTNSTEMLNKNTEMNRSQHFVLSYDYVMNNDLRFKVETYYQNLWGIPVYNFNSGISMINQGASFARFFPYAQMVNAGTAQNYGIEFTVEKFYSKNYYILFTSSIYNSTYQTKDGITRNTDYNGNYIFNLLAGYEPPIGKKKQVNLVTGLKVTYAGGRRYSPADRVRSNQLLDYYPQEDKINTLRFKNYFRLDVRLGIRINAKKVTHEIMVDLVNTLNINNPLSLSYTPDPIDPSKDPISINKQLGFLPLLYYKLDF
jgi:hypothetical protein